MLQRLTSKINRLRSYFYSNYRLLRGSVIRYFELIKRVVVSEISTLSTQISMRKLVIQIICFVVPAILSVWFIGTTSIIRLIIGNELPVDDRVSIYTKYLGCLTEEGHVQDFMCRWYYVYIVRKHYELFAPIDMIRLGAINSDIIKPIIQFSDTNCKNFNLELRSLKCGEIIDYLASNDDVFRINGVLPKYCEDHSQNIDPGFSMTERNGKWVHVEPNEDEAGCEKKPFWLQLFPK